MLPSVRAAPEFRVFPVFGGGCVRFIPRGLRQFEIARYEEADWPLYSGSSYSVALHEQSRFQAIIGALPPIISAWDGREPVDVLWLVGRHYFIPNLE